MARGLCKKLVLTRLPVGHTHEDIDSKFALIWKRMRDRFIFTPSAYAEAVITSLTTSKLSCQVHDIFAIPNYTKYIESYMDKKLGRFGVYLCAYFRCHIQLFSFVYLKSADMLNALTREMTGLSFSGRLLWYQYLNTFHVG